MLNLKLPDDRYQNVTVRLTGWVDKDLKCKLLGFEDLGEYIIKVDEISSGLLRRLELDKNLMKKKTGDDIDDDLNCLIGKIVTIYLLGGISFRYDLMTLEKDNSEEYKFEVKWIKRKLKEWYRFEWGNYVKNRIFKE